MEKFWNYFFYATWKSNVAFGRFVLKYGFYIIFNLFPFLRKNEKRGKIEFIKLMEDKDSGVNLGHAFGFMYVSTFLVYSAIYFAIIIPLEFENENIGFSLFIIMIFLAYFTNYILIYRADIYKKYFVQFEKIENQYLIYVSAILFHISLPIIAALIIHCTVGFHFD